MPEKPTYAITDWDRIFENAASRKVERLSWVAIPNRHDSAGYGRLISQPNGPAIYGAWVVMVQVASKMPKRGVLANESGPLDSLDLEARTRIPATLFDVTISTLLNDKIGWIYIVTGSTLPVRYQSATSPSGRTGAEGEGRGGKNTPLPPRGGKADDWETILPKLTPTFKTDRFKAAWESWAKYRRETRHALTPTTIGKQLEQFATEGVDRSIAAIETSIRAGWRKLVFDGLPISGIPPRPKPARGFTEETDGIYKSRLKEWEAQYGNGQAK